eukprot:COSAG06_NODE_25836_length_627_cov_5.998106_1_plen_67_part_10
MVALDAATVAQQLRGTPTLRGADTRATALDALETKKNGRRRESNPVHYLPKAVCFRYTTAPRRWECG